MENATHIQVTWRNMRDFIQRRKPIFCENCNVAFSCPSSLKMHRKTHKGKRQFWYKSCNKSFSHLFRLLEKTSINSYKRVNLMFLNYWLLRNTCHTFTISGFFSMLQINSLKEILVTLWASEWPLAYVGSLIHLQALWLCEKLVTCSRKVFPSVYRDFDFRHFFGYSFVWVI